MSDYKETGICCICGKEYTHWGNNPWPVSENVNDRCCDDCNFSVVLAARLGLMNKEKKGE